jgi:hypothetical protein
MAARSAERFRDTYEQGEDTWLPVPRPSGAHVVAIVPGGPKGANWIQRRSGQNWIPPAQNKNPQTLEVYGFKSTPHWIRTSNLRFRRPMLYPIELGVRESLWIAGVCRRPAAGIPA